MKIRWYDMVSEEEQSQEWAKVHHREPEDVSLEVVWPCIEDDARENPEKNFVLDDGWLQENGSTKGHMDTYN